MTVKFVPFEADHLLQLNIQPEQQDQVAAEAGSRRDLMMQSQLAYTAMADGRPVACGGVILLWAERALAWSYLGVDLGPHMRRVHRRAYQLMEETPVRRIETWVRCGFSAGHRWVRLLGFECEAERMRNFMPNGDDFALYARVR